MSSPRSPEQLIRQVFDLIKDAIPPGLEGAGHELKQSVRATITDALANMDVVTREEFEIQQKVLARTRQKLEALEKRAEVIEGILTRENTNLD